MLNYKFKLTEEYEQAYDKLVLSTGAAPIRPNVEGLDLPGINYEHAL